MPRCCASSPGPTTCPPTSIAQFKKETGIEVEVTLSNNEEMISKLRATGGAGFDLAQPSQDRITRRAAGIRHLQADRPEQGARWSSSCRELLETIEEERHARRQALRPAATSGAPTGWSSTPSSPRCADYADLCKPELQGQDRDAPEAPDADGLRVRQRQGSVRALQRHRRPTPRSWTRSARRSPPARRTCASSATTRTSC